MIPRRIFSCLLVFITIFLCASSALAEDAQIPAPVGDIYVQDFAHVLNDSEKVELNAIGRSIEERTTAQVAVLTVPSIGGRTIEEYANEAFRWYGIGSKKENNGVMLVLAMKEKRVRIEVGYGLEGRIPDGKAGRILDEYAIPYLKNGQPNRAVIETYKQLSKEVLAEYGQKAEGGTPAPSAQDEGIGIPAWIFVVAVAVVIFFDFKFFGGALTQLLLYIFTRGGGGGSSGGGGFKGGGGGSSGGGGASRGW